MSIFIIVAGFTLLCISFWLFRKATSIPLDNYSSQILIICAIIVTVFNLLFILSIGVTFTYILLINGERRIISYIPFVFISSSPLILLSSFFSTSRILKRKLHLEEIGDGRLVAHINELAGKLKVADVRLLSSTRINNPVLFGIHSRSSNLVVPESWSAPLDENEKGILYHELAHVINRDVGFMTWAWNLTYRGPTVLLIILFSTVLIFFSMRVFVLTGLQMFRIYLVSYIVLRVLYSVISRKREALADATAAIYAGSGKVNSALTIAKSGLTYLPLQKGSKIRNILDSIRLLLMDRVVFKKQAPITKTLYKIYRYLAEKSYSIQERKILMQKPMRKNVDVSLVSKESCIWLGIISGLLLSYAIFLYSFIFADVPSKQLITIVMNCVLIFIACLMTVVFALPAMVRPSPEEKPLLYILRLAECLGVCFFSVAIFSNLMIVGLPEWCGASFLLKHELPKLFKLLLIYFFGVTLLVSVLPGNLSGEIKTALRELYLFAVLFSVPILAIFTMLFVAFYFLVSVDARLGGTMLMALLLYLWIVSGSLKAELCYEDLYMYVKKPFCKEFIVYEGKIITPAHILYISLLFLLYSISAFAVIFMASYGLTLFLPRRLNVMSFLVPAAAIALLSTIDITHNIFKQPGFAKLRKIRSLIYALGISRAQIDKLYKSFFRQVEERLSLMKQKAGLQSINATFTMKQHYMLSQAASEADTALQYMDNLREVINDCKNETGGYGLWPGAGSRLSSTYYAMDILIRLNQGLDIDRVKHIEWITNCQEPSGWFKSPLSARSNWENTYFAISSLAMLDGISQMKHRREAEDWLHKTIYDGILHSDIHKVYCSGISLNLLYGLNEHDKKALRDFIVKAAPRLLHSKIRYVAEQIAQILELGKLDMNDEELKDLFPDLEIRLTSALEAELKPFIKKEKPRAKKQAAA